METNKEAVPFVGLVSKEGYIESYSYQTAKQHDFHHSFVLSSKGETLYYRDDTLRFVQYPGSQTYTLEGGPSLAPFEAGERQVMLFAQHVLKRGASPKTPVVVAEQHMGTPYEGKCIGTLDAWSG